MSSDIQTIKDFRALCAWLGCRREPTVQVEYGPGTSDALRQANLPDAQGGVVYVCADHAAELRAALAPGRLLSEKIIR